jgi:hypothetical protein
MFFSQDVPRKEGSLMRSRLVRFLAFSLVTGIALLGIGFGVVGHQGSTQTISQVHAKKALGPVGPWNLTVTFPDGSQSPSSLRLNPDGTLVNYTPGPGTGTWSMTSSNQFQYQFEEQIDDNQGNEVAYVDVQQQATLSADGTTYTAFGQGTVHAMDGSVQAVNQTTTQATQA